MTALRSMLAEALQGVRPLRAAGRSAPDEQLAARVVWSHLVEPGDAVAGRLIRSLGAHAALEVLQGGVALSAEVTQRELDEGRKRWSPRLSTGLVSSSLEAAARSEVRLVVPGDGDWPAGVDDLGPHAPLCLWVKGDPASLTLVPAVAIVGARAATSYGEHVAMELSANLAGGGIPVVSGGAYGIDGAAHRAAIAAGGVTVALLAGGVDRPYPAGHAHLLQRVAAQGAVVSEVPCGSPPTKWRFLQRNRLIAAASLATVVVEAGWRSGSLNTASHAMQLGREVGAVPGPITSAASAGSHRLLREGVACITGAHDIRELLGSDSATASTPVGGDAERTDDSTRVRDALSARSWREVDDIARRSGMSPGEVEAVLGLLLLSDEAERDLRGWRRRPSGGH